MADYTKLNFEDIESSTTSNEVDGRFMRSALGTTELGVSRFKYAPNFEAAMGHNHKVQEEVYVIEQGSGQIYLDEEVVDLKKGDVIRVAPPVIRAFKSSAEGLEVMCVGGQKPEGGDGERHEITWPK
jgi:mannose-6-phosphate isomerase-like protein (cupin superfamily)